MNELKNISRVAILGAGVMGAQIAAHMINARVPTLLFDLLGTEEAPNGIIEKSLENLKRLKPSPVALSGDTAYIETLNYDRDLHRLAECDLVIEAIAERIDWKTQLYQKIAPHLSSHTILATNTSGLSIAKLSASLSHDLKTRFCGVHFFNPPRYMSLVELIPAIATQPHILDTLEIFLTSTLGKNVLRTKDTPNFIANRIGVFSTLSVFKRAEEFGLSIDLVDDLTGPKLGRARSATFRTADVIGLDILSHAIKTMQDNLAQDPFHSLYGTPPILQQLIEQGALGQKTGGGFYRKENQQIQVLDPHTGIYSPLSHQADPLIDQIL